MMMIISLKVFVVNCINRHLIPMKIPFKIEIGLIYLFLFFFLADAKMTNTHMKCLCEKMFHYKIFLKKIVKTRSIRFKRMKMKNTCDTHLREICLTDKQQTNHTNE